VKLKTLFLVSLVAIACLSLAAFVQAPRPFRGFTITTQPDLIEAAPGDFVTVNGSIYSFGFYWLHDFNISVKGLPDSYKLEVVPQHFEHVRAIREWNPKQGLYYVPERFFIMIKVPSDSAGIYTVNVTGQEFQSWKKLSNSTSFILRVTSPPKLSISDINVPETIVEYEAFNVSFTVNNEGLVDQAVTLSMQVPEDWYITPNTQTATVGAGYFETFIFSITPTNTSGQISAVLEYPFRQTIINMTKTGPYLIPTTPAAPGIELPTGLVVWIDSLVTFAKENPIVIIVIIVVIAIIIWYFLSTYKFYVTRKKPEEVKKEGRESRRQIELPASDITSTL
jgi:hypothetical protein